MFLFFLVQDSITPKVIFKKVVYQIMVETLFMWDEMFIKAPFFFMRGRYCVERAIGDQ